MHWNKQKDLKVMLEPKRLCTLLPGTHCMKEEKMCTSLLPEPSQVLLVVEHRDLSLSLLTDSYLKYQSAVQNGSSCIPVDSAVVQT